MGIKVQSYQFKIQFFGPVTIATGKASETGADIEVNLDDPIPASSLKGVLRASAEMLGMPIELVNEVFGYKTPHDEAAVERALAVEGVSSPWWFSSAHNFEWQPQMRQARSRVRIDDDTGTAADRGLFQLDEIWPQTALFEIEQHSYINPERLALHGQVLLLAAHGTHSLGGSRRRGSGWVQMERVKPAPETDLSQAVSLVSGGAQ